ncbi:hypothetical protein HED63_25935 [Ochrobactrum cytisi]|nr:hypothetical protein [Brucella cytisi]
MGAGAGRRCIRRGVRRREDRNPSWPMRAEQGFTYLDGDFVETIWGTGPTGSEANWGYLASLLDPDDVGRCKDRSGAFEHPDRDR